MPAAVINCTFVKRLCKPFFYRKNDLQNRFTENSEVKRLCKPFFIGKTICKIVLLKILKSQIMTVTRI